MSTGNQHVGEAMTKVSGKIGKITTEYYKSLNFGKFKRNTIGESQSKHKNLWYLKNGKVADEFRTKNPYLMDQDNVLQENESDYLKQMLLIINTWKLGIPDVEAAKIDPTTLESVTKHPKIKEAIENGTYFDMPLIRREEITRYQDIFSNPKKVWSEKFQPY